ncbi:MAG: phage minor head protein [Aggregatilineales bacterium]
MSANSPAPRVSDLIRNLLDRGYTQATSAVVNALGRSVSSGIVAQRLNELEAEAGRLAEAGERLDVNNPVVRALLADLEPRLRANGLLIDGAAGDLQNSGVNSAGQITRQLALPGMSDEALARIGVQWNRPDPEAVNALVGYVDSDAWAAELARYPELVISTVRNQAVRGIVEGWSPLRTAREIRRMAEGVTRAQAETLMRTLQLQSYRTAAAVHQQANAGILTEQIRIAALDNRTCLACIGLHGTRLPIGERVNDHHNGRCTSIAVVRGRPREVQTGEDWFNAQPEARRVQIAGRANFEAMQAGRVQLRDFAQTYDDPVFGEMIREASLKGILGDDAREFYGR